MAFDSMPGGDPHGPWCQACRRPIIQGEPVTRVHFQNDPKGAQGLSGTYHKQCSKPFQSLARVVNLNPWSRF